MDYRQTHRYMRPPPPLPPSMADPHHQPPLRQPVPPPGGPWYSGQFQYQPPSPPPPRQQWAPPSHHSDHLPPPPYAAPPPHPSYPAHSLPSQYPPPPPPPQSHRPQVPPPCHPHSQISQSFPQDWGNANGGPHQSWEYPVAVQHNEEDWAAKARAWAAAQAVTDNQHSQSQFIQVGRLEEQSHYYDRYPQTADPFQLLLPASGYQQYPPPAAPPHRPPVVHLQESASISSGQSSFVPDEHLAYSARDGNLTGDSNAVFAHQESSPTSSAVHLQEVPSSYSSVTGKEEAGIQNEKFFKSFHLPIDSSQGPHHVHLPLPAVGRSVSMEQPYYAVGNQSMEVPTDLSDQPLVFSHRFSHNHDPLTQPKSGGPMRGVDPVAAAPSNHSWTPPGAVYPPIPPVLQSGQQHDPSIAVPSPVPGHSAPLFGRMPGSSFQSTIPSVGAPFGIGAGSGLHPTTAFPGDVYMVSSVSERPKKASVPNWLREEIIKKKAVIVNAASELKEEIESIEAVDKSLGKADQADSKSIDSSKFTEEDDDDEDYVEAARMAAINQEIKHILTEVLLKVTDELFDEIATKVLGEDDLTVEVEQNVVTPNHKLSPSAPAVPTPNPSARVLIPAKTKGTENEDNSGKSTSSSPGDVLGLASYASDDGEDDDDTVHQRPSNRKLSEDKHAVENGSPQEKTEGHSKGLRHVEGDTGRMVPNGTTINHSAIVNVLSDNRTGRVSSGGTVGSSYSSKMVSGAAEDEDNIDGDKRLESSDASGPNHSVGEKVMKTELPLENITAKMSATDDSQVMETRNKQDKNDRRETKRSSAGKGIVKEVDSGKDRTDESHRRQEERHVKKEQGGKSRGKAKESESGKRSGHPDVKEDRKEKERDRRTNEEDCDRRRERRKDEKGERSRHKLASESSRHKRRHSSSVGSRGRSSKDNSVVSYANDASDESSDDSKRKLHSKRRNLSPSPNRSRRRQDSRSPHSKHSQRRHSPYSSFETTRGRRSRSRSPVRRQR